MPVPSVDIATPTSIRVLIHRTANDFLNAAWPAVSKREAAANLILPDALQRVSQEWANQTLLDDGDDGLPSSKRDTHVHANALRVSPNTPRTGTPDGHLWLTCWSGYERDSPCLDIILSCTEGSFGPHPIFLWSSLASSQTTQEYLDPRIATLAEHLSAAIPVTRVFSVFGPTLLTKTFSKQWSHITGVTQITEPLYVERLFCATREKLPECLCPALPPGDVIRLGSPPDILAIGQLCKEFSETSVYYPLSLEEAIREATELVFFNQVWVYETDGTITTIAEVDSISPNVATITKVHTSATRRKGGCAERLVRKVVEEMFYNMGKQRVTFYVGNQTMAAKICDRLGTQGHWGEDGREEIEEYMEVGFRGMPRGHW